MLPTNASRRGTIEACERSLRRLATDRLDLYLLHWPGSHPLGETVAAFVELVERGRIRSWGVSNFDARDLDALLAVTGGDGVATDQVLYNLGRRGIEHDLLPWSRRRRMPVMAYSPIDQAALVHHPVVRAVAADHGATAAQVALAWVLRQDGVCTIPKASSPAHVHDNRGALSLAAHRGRPRAARRRLPPARRARAARGPLVAPFRKSGAFSDDRLGVRGKDAGRPDSATIGPPCVLPTDAEPPSDNVPRLTERCTSRSLGLDRPEALHAFLAFVAGGRLDVGPQQHRAEDRAGEREERPDDERSVVAAVERLAARCCRRRAGCRCGTPPGSRAPPGRARRPS